MFQNTYGEVSQFAQSSSLTPRYRHCGLVELACTWDETGYELNSWQCRIYISYPMFIEPGVLWVDIWLDTKIVLKRYKT